MFQVEVGSGQIASAPIDDVTEGRERRLNLEVRVSQGEACITPHGSLQADMVLEGLHKTLGLIKGPARLYLDLSDSRDLDNLALSALIVLLRSQGRRFKRIVITGLQSWAIGRLCRMGSEHILGQSWTGFFTPSRASFIRA